MLSWGKLAVAGVTAGKTGSVPVLPEVTGCNDSVAALGCSGNGLADQ